MILSASFSIVGQTYGAYQEIRSNCVKSTVYHIRFAENFTQYLAQLFLKRRRIAAFVAFEDKKIVTMIFNRCSGVIVLSELLI